MEETVATAQLAIPDAATPLIRSGERNLKNKVIDTLGHHWPLNARQIYREISSEPGQSITYQGVHKALRQLQEQGVIENTHCGNQLNYAWISQLQAYSGNLHENYTIGRNTDFYEMLNGDSLTLEYPNYFRAVQAVCAIIARKTEKTGEPDEILIDSAHPFPIMGLPFGMLKKIGELTGSGKAKILGTYNSNTKTDRELAKLWNSTGVKWRHPRKANPAKAYNMLTRDILIQFAMCPQFHRAATQILNGKGAPTTEKIYEYTALCESAESKATVIITKNAELAGKIREENKRK